MKQTVFSSLSATATSNLCMTGPNEQDDNDSGDLDGLHGPTESDIERFNREDSEYLDYRKRDARAAAWKLIAGGVFMLFVAAMFLNVLLPAFTRNRQIDVGPVRTPATVTRIFDGRTIGVEVDGVERTIRYIGVETPIFGDRFYELAIEANTQWMLGADVQLEADELDADREGRLLRYVWLDGGMVNNSLIAVGLAEAETTGPNRRYADLFADAEAAARANAAGIWEDVEPDRSAVLPASGERSVLTSGPA